MRRTDFVSTAFRSLVVVLLCGSTSSAQEWTRFRGPNGTGISEATTIPTTWTEADFNWKIELPGNGHSQPVLWGDKIFLTCSNDEGAERVVLCLDVASGDTVWKKKIPSRTHKRHSLNSFASATPAVDEDQVYVAFSTPDRYSLIAFDHAGGERWDADLGPYASQHSCGSSPILFEDMVILGNEQDGPSSLIAVDRKTGKKRWETPRRTSLTAYSTPCVYLPPAGEPQLIFNSKAHGISAVDAHTGSLIWEAPLLDKRSCSSPIVAGGAIIGTCGSGGGGEYLVAIRPGGRGDVSDSHVAYKIERGAPYVPTPVVNGDLLFLWTRNGIVTCADARDGRQIWQKRVGGNYYGSPVRVRDRIYCMSADGECVVVRAAEEYELLARNPLGEGSHSTPAVAGGRMYLRTFNHLISVGGADSSGDAKTASE